MLLACVAVAGCKRDDMAEQPKMRTYEPAKMFIDGAEARPLVAGVVAPPLRIPLAVPTHINGNPARPAQPTRHPKKRGSHLPSTEC